MVLPSIDPLIAGGVVVTTALTDAIYVQFTAAVAARRGLRRRRGAAPGTCSRRSRSSATRRIGSMWCSRRWARGSGGFLSITALNRAAQSRPGEGRGSPHGGGPT